jgi:hypothetical protein
LPEIDRLCRSRELKPALAPGFVAQILLLPTTESAELSVLPRWPSLLNHLLGVTFMKLLALIVCSALLAASSSAIAGGIDKNKLEKVQAMAKLQQSQDIKVEVTHQDKAELCGTEGPAFMVEIKVKHLVRDLSEKSEMGIKEKWETIKTYGILDSDVGTPEKLFDGEGCLE